MKKTGALLTTLVLALTMLLSACSGSGSKTGDTTNSATPSNSSASSPAADSGEKVTLNIMHNWSSDDKAHTATIQGIFNEFMKENPNITIKQEIFQDGDIPPKVETAFLAKQEPDIVFSNLFTATLSWVDKGVTVPVNDLLKNAGLDGKFKDLAIQQYTNGNGKLMAFPLEGFTWPIWYNTKILKAAGVDVPKTLAEFIADVPKIRAAGYEPLVTGGNDWTGMCLFELIVQSMLTDKETEQVFGKGDWDNPHALAGVQAFVDLRDAGGFDKNSAGMQLENMEQQFFSGKAAAMHDGSWSYSQLPANMQSDVVLGGFPLPAGSPHQTPVMYSAFTGKGIFITRNGATKMDAVQKFIQFFYKPENIAQFVVNATDLSPLKDTPVDDSKLNPQFKQSLSLDATVVEVLDTVMPATVDMSLVTKEAYLTDKKMTAAQIVDALKKLYQDSNK